MQATNWIKKKEGTALKVININDGAGVFLRPLENSIKFGTPLLFENAD